jgi:membrane-bound lytic murein transglycosylase
MNSGMTMYRNRVKSDNEQRYDHVPKMVDTGQEGTVTVVFDQQVQTDTTIRDNKPNTLIRDYEKGTRLLIDTDM